MTDHSLTRRTLLRASSAAALTWLARSRAARADDVSAERSIDSRRLVTPETERAIARGLEWLRQRQQPEGFFGPPTSFNRYRMNPAVNALAAMAFLASGSTPERGPYGDTLTAAVQYLLSCAAPSGFISEQDPSYYEQPMYGHGFATLLLAEVYGVTRLPVRDPLRRAVRLIIDTQNHEGGWRYAPEPRDADISVTVCQAMALRAAHNGGLAVPREVIDRVVSYITRCQNPDGGFKYQLNRGSESAFPRSAAALVALYTCGVTSGPVIENGLKYMLRFRPGEPGLREPGYYFYAHYYAVQAAWHAGRDVFEVWYPAIRDELLANQLSAGSWSDQGVSPEYATAMALIVLQLPNNYLPIFHR